MARLAGKASLKAGSIVLDVATLSVYLTARSNTKARRGVRRCCLTLASSGPWSRAVLLIHQSINQSIDQTIAPPSS